MKNNLNSFIIALAVVISAVFLGNAWKVSHSNRSIQVTGLATKDFVSDLIVWNASFSEKSATLKEAYLALKMDADRIKRYLLAKGLNESDLIFSAIDIEKQYKRGMQSGGFETQTFDGYSLTQSVQIESKEVDKVENISRQATELIDSGIEISSNAPNYYYTRLAELKIEMLASASKDARNRAEKIAENAGGRISDLRSAEMGIFQITAPNSTDEYSWGGAYNTTSKRKTASITVKLDFYVK